MNRPPSSVRILINQDPTPEPSVGRAWWDTEIETEIMQEGKDYVPRTRIVPGVHIADEHDNRNLTNRGWSGDREPSPTRRIPTVECPSCKSNVFKCGALNRLACHCGYSFCGICSMKLPASSFDLRAFKHFCLHQRFSRRKCRECNACALYEQSAQHEDVNNNVEGDPASRDTSPSCEGEMTPETKSPRGRMHERIIRSSKGTRQKRWLFRQKSSASSSVGDHTGYTGFLKDNRTHVSGLRGLDIGVDLECDDQQALRTKAEGHASKESDDKTLRRKVETTVESDEQKLENRRFPLTVSPFKLGGNSLRDRLREESDSDTDVDILD